MRSRRKNWSLKMCCSHTWTTGTSMYCPTTPLGLTWHMMGTGCGFDTENLNYFMHFFVKFPIVGWHCLSNTPWWDEIFRSNSPLYSHWSPRGVVGQYIDRCIKLLLLSLCVTTRLSIINFPTAKIRIQLYKVNISGTTAENLQFHILMQLMNWRDQLQSLMSCC